MVIHDMRGPTNSFKFALAQLSLMVKEVIGQRGSPETTHDFEISLMKKIERKIQSDLPRLVRE